MPRRGYPPEFRRRALYLIASGRKVVEVARDLGISDQTLYTWRRQERIDRGETPGLSSVEQAELTAARVASGSSRPRWPSIGVPPSC